MACGPRYFDITGGAAALTKWIEKMESVIDNSGCLANQRDDFKALLIMEFSLRTKIEKLEAAILTGGILIDEAVRSGTLAKAGEKMKERDEASKSKSARKDEKKAKGGRGPDHMARDCRTPVRHAELIRAVRLRDGQRACYEWKIHCVLVQAFWFLHFVSCDLVLRFGPTFYFKTCWVLPKDKLHFLDVPNDVIKLMMFPYSLEGNPRVWEMLRACPHHEFIELAQIDTFYNGLNDKDQDSLNAAAGGNLLSKTTREALQIIENNSKVRYSRNKLNVSRMNTTSRDNASKSDDKIDKLADQISTLVDIFAKKIVTPASVKAVEESCVTCGVEQKIEETTDNEQTNFQGSTAHIQPPVTPIPEPDVPKTLPKPNIPYPSRLNDQKLHEKATNQMEKFFQIFQDLHFDISFSDALLLMPKFASTIKSLLTNKDKLFELSKIPLNENCSMMLLKKLLEKLGDPGKFLIPCDFPRMDESPKTLSSKWGTFHFPTDFVVVNFEADPCVPLILGRSFLRTDRALIDVYGEEITLQVNDEAVTFNLNQTTRYSSTYDDLSVNRIDIINVAREEYAQEILGFYSNSSGGNPTSTFKPILSDSSHSLTPFEGSDFILEEIDAYLKDESVSLKIDHADYDPEGDICLIENLLNDKPFQLPLMNLKQGEVIKVKSLIEEPPELESKELPPYLEYAYLEGVDKLPVVISKDLKVDEKEALLKVLKYHKRAIAWKITNIKGIDPRFCTHKILMEEDYKLAVQSQRRVNPKIHEVTKKEVIKLLDAAIKYLLSKQDAKPRLIRWVLLLQEFDIIIRDKKRTENRAADHLSRLENPHKDVFENKDKNKNFPLETLGKIYSGGTSWFAEFTNFHARNFIVKGMSSQQKKKFFKDVKHYF
nr:reverse transcriptase domain-containing protein [Tanacetum cinerariifolium]